MLGAIWAFYSLFKEMRESCKSNQGNCRGDWEGDTIEIDKTIFTVRPSGSRIGSDVLRQEAMMDLSR